MDIEAADFDRLREVYGAFNAALDPEAVRQSSLRVKSTNDERVLIETGQHRGDGGSGPGYWEVLRVNDDFLLCAANDYYDERFRFDIQTGMDTLAIRFIHTGELALRPAGSDDLVINANSASVVHLSGERAYELMIRERQRLLSVTVHVRADRLWSEVGLEPDEAPTLNAWLDARDRKAAVPMTASMNNGVMDILANRLRGRLRRRYLEVKAQELLCLFVESVEGAAPRPTLLRPQDEIRLHEARALLLRNLSDPPTVERLARDVGLNRTTLRRGFKEMFGETIADFCQNHRMTLARTLLRDQRYSIGEIAGIVGYGQLTNFTAAFRRHFKAPPSMFRN